MSLTRKKASANSPTQPEREQSDTGKRADWPTRLIYCLALLSFIIGHLIQGSWVSLATGGGLLGWAGKFLSSVIVACLFYRIYLVLRYENTLRARKPNMLGWAVRNLGVLAMLASTLGMASMFLIKPLTLLLFKSAGENGIGFFVVGVYAVMLSRTGWVGCLLFELSRFMGKRPTRNRRPDSTRRTSQDLVAAVAIVVLVVSAPFALQAALGKPCYGPTRIRCIANIEGGVTRPAVAPYGSTVYLATNIDDIVYPEKSKSREEIKESPTFSLSKAGHPVTGAVASEIRVLLTADPLSNGIAITLQVFDEQGESAKFVTKIKKYAHLEPGKDGNKKVIINLPRNVQAGLSYLLRDPVTKQSYVLDEIFSQMRQAIVSPREASELALRTSRTARLISDIASSKKIDDRKLAASCRDTVKIDNVGDNETALRPIAGSPLHRLIFISAEDPDFYALAQVNDRIGCNSDGVWAFNNPAWDGGFEIRRFSKDGRLLNYVSVTLPVDKSDRGWADVEGGEISGDKMIFSLLSIERANQSKRRVFELDL